MNLTIYPKVARPAAAVVVAFGILSAVLLVISEPQMSGVDPGVLRAWLVGVLVAFGILAPGLALVLPRFVRPSWWGLLSFFLAMTANAVVFGADAGLPTRLPLLLAMAVGLLACTLGLLSLAERPSTEPPQATP